MHPILIRIGSVEIRYYGVMIAIAFIAGAIIGEKEAKLFITYLIGYGVIRFFLEFFRGDSLLLLNRIPVPHAISVVMIILGSSLYMYRSKTGSIKSS